MIKSLHIPIYVAPKEDVEFIRRVSGASNATRLWWGCKTNPKYYLDFYASKEELALAKDSAQLVQNLQTGYVFQNTHKVLKSINIPDWTNTLGQKITSSLELAEFTKTSSHIFPIWATNKHSLPYKVQGSFLDHFHQFFVGAMSSLAGVHPIFIAPIKPFETSRPFASSEVQVLVQQWAENLAANKDVKDFLLTTNKL
jgi:hypothetical protein